MNTCFPLKILSYCRHFLQAVVLTCTFLFIFPNYASSAIVFSDDFESGTANWTFSAPGNAGTSTQTSQSATRSLYLRSTAVQADSDPIDLAGESIVSFRFWLRRGDDSFSEDPDNNEDLVVYYLNNAGSWIQLERFAGNSTPGEIFQRDFTLSANAFHSNFRVRFDKEGGNSGDFDYWHIDDVIVETTAVTMCPDSNGYTQIFADDFEDGNRNGWTPIEFDYSISNYPGETVSDAGQTSNTEWLNDWTVFTGDLWWNRGGNNGSADEYGMLSYDLSGSYSISTISEYSIKVNINGYPDDPQNNDAGIVFGYIDNSNYYVLRWTKMGSTYGSSTMPGVFRRLTMVRVSAGAATILGTYNNFYDNGEFELKVTVRPDGIHACVDGNSLITYTGADRPYLNLFGLYSFDNDNGVSYDDVEVRANILQCFNDDFNRTNLGGDWAVSHTQGSFGDPRIVNGRLRLTDSSNNVATAATLLRLFPGSGNKITYEFDHFAYNGNGADGIAIALSDGTVTPVPGGYGGSLGYAQRCGISGFAGGWLGLGIDEYGNFRNDGECRGDGGPPSGRVLDSVSVRGSGAGTTGYLLHAESGALNPPVDNAGSSTPAFGHRYRVTIDHTNNLNAYVGIERDTGSGFQTIIPTYDANSQTGQAPVPAQWLISMTGSTGGARNIHEIDDLEVCATSLLPYNSIDHYRFSHDGSALTCSPENIQVRACLDADCTVEFAGNVNTTLSPSGWIGGDSQTFLSGDSLQLWHTTVGTPTLDISGNSSEFIAINPPRCFIGATEQADCTLPFYDSGFILDVPDHIADVTQNVTMSAVRRDPLAPQQCVPGFQNVTKNVSFWSDYLDPGSGTLPVRVDSTPVSTSPPGPGTLLSLNFDNNGEVVIPVAYADVGQMNLYVLYQGSGDDAGLVMTGVDSFITRPDHFNVTVPGNLGAADASGPVFRVAGELFQVEVSAINASGDVTPNYGNEAVAESVQLTRNLLAPAGQNNPVLGGSFNPFGTNCNGNAASGYACGLFSWEEVGVIELVPAVADGNYLGTGNVTGNSSGNVGRFIPDRFAVADNNPQLGHGCVSGSFTYLGQEIGFLVNPIVTVTALGTTGATLNNYGDSFWKYAGVMTNRAYSHAGPEVVTVNLSTVGAANLSGNLDYDGTGTVEIVGDRLTYVKPITPIIPFDTDVDLDLSIADLTDGDGVCYDLDNDGTCGGYTIGSIGNSEQRYGRMLLKNAYGPETLPLTIPVIAEFYNGTAFVLNDLDNCTSYDSIYAQLGNFQGNLTSANTSASGSGVLVSGIGNNLLLAAPGVGNEGSVDVTLDLSQAAPGADLEWLQFDWDGDGINDNPTAKATFGIFKGNQRLIYMRESIW